mmetsp:Transcript_13505/g.33149  ORF Transcript_13505/g.33149 Transcript_13505/m.33149 type:complete len:429 (-) Transcript_13505:233-1519(-)
MRAFPAALFSAVVNLRKTPFTRFTAPSAPSRTRSTVPRATCSASTSTTSISAPRTASPKLSCCSSLCSSWATLESGMSRTPETPSVAQLHMAAAFSRRSAILDFFFLLFCSSPAAASSSLSPAEASSASCRATLFPAVGVEPATALAEVFSKEVLSFWSALDASAEPSFLSFAIAHLSFMDCTHFSFSVVDSVPATTLSLTDVLAPFAFCRMALKGSSASFLQTYTHIFSVISPFPSPFVLSPLPAPPSPIESPPCSPRPLPRAAAAVSPPFSPPFPSPFASRSTPPFSLPFPLPFASRSTAPSAPSRSLLSPLSRRLPSLLAPAAAPAPASPSIRPSPLPPFRPRLPLPLSPSVSSCRSRPLIDWARTGCCSMVAVSSKSTNRRDNTILLLSRFEDLLHSTVFCGKGNRTVLIRMLYDLLSLCPPEQ